MCNAFFRNPSALNFENKIQWIKNVTRKISQMKLSSSWVIVMVGLTYLLSKPNAIVSLRKASWKKSCLFENAASLFLYSPPPFAKDLYFFQFFNHDSWFYFPHQFKPHLIKGTNASHLSFSGRFITCVPYLPKGSFLSCRIT